MEEHPPSVRASDADRERVAFTLQTALSEGRISLQEFDERVARAYGATTYGDLAAVTSDLPLGDPELGRRNVRDPDWAGRPPAFRSSVARRPARPAPQLALRSAWLTYLSVNLVCLVVWGCIALGEGAQGWWFLWVAGPWGAVLGVSELRARLR